MKKYHIHLALLFLSFALAFPVSAQNNYASEFREFDRQDSLKDNTHTKILFTGSSTIRFWKSLNAELGRTDLLNRGFGGSNMKEMYQFRDRLITKYHPSKVFLYEGDNDIAQGQPVDTIIAYAHTLINSVRKDLKCKFYFISVKPSPSRTKFLDRQMDLNNKLKALGQEFPEVYFIDIFKLFYNEGNIPEKYFEADKLHLNSSGYKLVSQEVLPCLDK